jgi:hypothetical protein
MDRQKITRPPCTCMAISQVMHIRKNVLDGVLQEVKHMAYIQLALHQIPATKLKYLIILVLIYLGSSQQWIDLSTDH